MNDALLTIRAVTMSYGTGARKVLGRFSANITSGERVAVVGQNGSGKTTLLRILLGLVAPTEGIFETSFKDGEWAHWVPQDYRSALFPWLRFRQNLLLAFRRNMAGRMAKESEAEVMRRYDDLARQLHLRVNLDKPSDEASGGEKQLFLLVRALIDTPRLLVLDEPFAAIDYARKQLIRKFLGEELARRPLTTFVFATHDFDDAVFLADRVFILGKDESESFQELGVNLPWPRTAEVRETEEYRRVIAAIVGSVL